MVKHSTLKEETIKAKEPATKTRNKKYTKTRPKKNEPREAPQQPSPNLKWRAKTSLYRLFCCQNTVYSVILYAVLLIFVTLFIYAAWKFSVVYLATRFHKPTQQLHDGKTNNSSQSPWKSMQDDRNETKAHHIYQENFNENLLKKTSPKTADVSENSGLSSNEKWKTQLLGPNLEPKNEQGHLPPWLSSPWNQNYQNPQDVQGDKRYIIPPSPSYLRSQNDNKKKNNVFEGSGENQLEQWRTIRYNLLKNRLQLTTASSIPTESPYWKAWYMSRYTTRSPFLGNHLRESQKNDSIYPVYDDLSKALPPAFEHTELIPKVVISKPGENEFFKHSKIEQVRSKTTMPSAYSKLLEDLFSKLPALRGMQGTVKPVRPKSSPRVSDSTNSSFLTSLFSAWQKKFGSHGASNGGRSNLGLSTQKPTLANITTKRTAATTKALMTNGTTTPKRTTTSVTNATTIPATATTRKITTLSTTKATTATTMKTTTATTMKTTKQTTALTTSTKPTMKGTETITSNRKKKSKKKHHESRKHHSRKRHHSGKKKNHAANGDAAEKHGSNKKRKKSGKGYRLQGSDLPMATIGGLGSDAASSLNVDEGGSGSGSGVGSGLNHGESGSGESASIADNLTAAMEESHNHGYVGLRERLRDLRKKKTTKGHRRKIKSKDEDIQEKGTTRDVISRKKHHHEKKSKHKAQRKSKHSKKVHGEKKTKAKKRKTSRQHSNKHKFMKIVQHKLLRMKQKNQIASRLKKVQDKMRNVGKQKHGKKEVKGNKRDSIVGSSHDKKLLDKRILRKEEPKHWRQGQLSLEKCAILREFDHHHYIGLNKLWRSSGKNTFAVTECSSNTRHKRRVKCRRTFYRTQGYLGLKPAKSGKKRRLYLIVCNKKENLEKMLKGGLEHTKKTDIQYTNRKKHDAKKSKKKRRKGKHKRKGHKKSEKTLSKKSHISRHKSRSSKKGHKRRHRKHHDRRSKRHRKHKKKISKSKDDDDDNDGESGSGTDEKFSGDEEERVERSTSTSNKTKHHRRHRRKMERKRKKKLDVSHEKALNATKNVENRTRNADSSGQVRKDSSRLYAEFADMMAEMKQEIKNVTMMKNGLTNDKTFASSTNTSVVMANKSVEAANTTLNRKEGLKLSSKMNETKEKTNTSKNAINSGTIQDMVAQLVPAIMKQIQTKPLQLPTSPINTKTTSKLLQDTTKQTTTVKSIPTKAKASASTTNATTTTTVKTTPTTKPVTTTKVRPTPHQTTHHHTTAHHTSMAQHLSTKKHSKPQPKTTSAPNLALIIKGLKALGISSLGQHTSTGKPSQAGAKTDQLPTNQAEKKSVKPTVKAAKIKQPPLPPPIPKPAKLHNQFMMNILCFGDSLTAGYHNHGKAFSPYGNHLKQLISYATRIPVSTTIKGIVGEMTHKQMVSRLPEILGNNSVFDWVIILGGTNDILHVKNFADDQEFLNQLESVWQPRITKDIEKLHNIAHSYGARSMLLTVPENAIEVWPEYRILMTMRTKINNALRQFANQNRDKILFCDLAKRLPRHSLTPQQEALFWDDHLHMTPRGYDRMAEEVFKCLKPYIPKG
ncbi:uncharacterized protein LOC135682333 [Rhopilema esculentum]|uniref:uncharacterized protein LOC135682333 n=1 Tax=Rhopilema esculentum TaxID=499914 RepID=UPI0031E06783|eukprot:gene14204-5214_t